MCSTITSSDFPQQHPAQMWGRRRQGSLYLKWPTSVVWKSQPQIKVSKVLIMSSKSSRTLHTQPTLKILNAFFQMFVFKYIQNTLLHLSWQLYKHVLLDICYLDTLKSKWLLEKYLKDLQIMKIIVDTCEEEDCWCGRTVLEANLISTVNKSSFMWLCTVAHQYSIVLVRKCGSKNIKWIRVHCRVLSITELGWEVEDRRFKNRKSAWVRSVEMCLFLVLMSSRQ